ncbi:hypothetical protein [Frankia sp. KB5]|uniref:hypothetical protein n=1 Tax=Frankia sp. KB5 TaxID=683318 RepID=UPI000A10373E|nr:hypothetical protein [Frankia sp. KB5]ORT46753.1 hypothetical protein KBI5_23480 [Frankia sp. KB5]
MDTDIAAILTKLDQVDPTDPRDLRRVCDTAAAALAVAGVEPPFQVRAVDAVGDPRLICSRLYWGRRLLTEPTMEVAAQCARWLAAHTNDLTAQQRDAIVEAWSLGFADATRDTVDSRYDIAAATGRLADQPADVRSFVVLYHAAKLRANYWFDELDLFLESSPLIATGRDQTHGPLLAALRAFAAFGSRRRTVEYATGLFTQAWDAAPRSRQVVDVCLDGLRVAPPFEGRGEFLRRHAAEAATTYPDDHKIRYCLAQGQRMCGLLPEALDTIGTAIRLLSAAGEWDSAARPRYLQEHDFICDLRRQSREDAAQQAGADEDRAAVRQLQRRLRDPSALMGMVVLVVVLDVVLVILAGRSSAAGAPDLRARLGMQAALGGSLLLLVAFVSAMARLIVLGCRRSPR